MPNIFYIKYFDGTVMEDSPNRLEFFLLEKDVKKRRDEILREIAIRGGKDKCDIYYDGGYGNFMYRDVCRLLDCLNDINEVYNT